MSCIDKTKIKRGREWRNSKTDLQDEIKKNIA